MGKIWELLDGKKTTLSAIIFLGNIIFRAASGGEVDPAELGAAIIGVVGLLHKSIKSK